ncbi:hypothetical protein B4U79_17241 [Dinothrombium tinctorium]|uniref:Fibronectin type-III domain-containing protein n=1 Tax=Dinothrombium tinctorium TaxID=1965070 RepID=A0A443RIQ3_9ACAR|nr:hypothetical protein B4U79_17241 [Dinothrombium tinctorium]
MLNNSNSLTMSGPPHFVDLHVNPGESVSIQLFDGNETLLRGPATITMISQHTFPPIPMPVQVPPGHMVQQIVDENGTLRHIILSAVNNNGTTTPATTLIPPPPPPPQQQPFPYSCCCCCYNCNTGATPLPAPPPPPPPPPPNYTNLLTFPAPVNIRRRLPARNFSYTKRSTTTPPTNTYHTVTTKSPSRGKTVTLSDSQEPLSKIIIPENSIPEQNCELTSDVKASNSKIDSLSPSVSPSPSVELSLNYPNGECKPNGDIEGLGSNDSEEDNASDFVCSAISHSPLKNEKKRSIEEPVDSCNERKRTPSLSKHHSESSEALSIDTETTELLNENEIKDALVKPELGCDLPNIVKNLEENESQHVTSKWVEKETKVENSSEVLIDDLIRNKEENGEKSNALDSEDIAIENRIEESSEKAIASDVENVEKSEMATKTSNDESNIKEKESKDQIEVRESVSSKPSPHRSPKHLLPQLQVWNLTYTSLTATTVKLKWTSQPANNSQSSISIPRHYMVEMILTKSNGNNGSPVPATRIVYQGSLSSCRVSHLNSQQQYSFRVRIVSENHLLVSNVLTITTPEQPLNKHHKRSKQQSLQQQIQQQQQQLLQQQLLLHQQQQQHEADVRNKEPEEQSNEKSDQRCAIVILLSFTVIAVIVAYLIQQLLTE